MADGRDAQIAKLRAELESARAEAERRIEGLKKQQTESKAKAKAIIQRQGEESRKKIHALEEDARLRSEELTQVKCMLRSAEDEKSALLKQADALKQDNSQLQQRIDSITAQCQREEQARRAADLATSDACAERDRMASQLSDLREQMKAMEQTPSPTTTISSSDLVDSGNVSSSSKDNRDNTDGDSTTATSSSSATEQLSAELFKSRQRSELLAKQLEKANADLDARSQEHSNIVKGLRDTQATLQQNLTKAENRVSELETQLRAAEDEAKSAKQLASRQVEAASVAASSSGSDEEKKVLEAKIEEMERLVASKQAEIGRVRDKARTYLKEMNAEKRTMAEKSKASLDELQHQLDAEREKLVAMEQKAETASKEVDNCLSVIREKQKSMQMLRMNVTTQKKVADEAKQETETLRTEFMRYKERARLALQEKENSGGVTEADVDAATSNMRSELERARKETHNLRKRVEQLRRVELSVDEMRERAERAETVADLLRKDATGGVVTANTNFSQVDRLEEKIVKLENELSSARSETEDVRSRHTTTHMRLESTEKALHAAELRSRNMEANARKTIESLKSKVEELEVARKKAQEAAAAAQRTAAAAAKALAFSASSASDDNDNMNNNNKTDRHSGTDHRDSRVQDFVNGGYDIDIDANGPRSTFAAALEDQSDKLGLSPRRNASGTSPRNSNASSKSSNIAANSEGGNFADTSAADLEARDQQIAVLTTQLAELGALFDEVQRESELRGEQMELLKAEVKNLDGKLASAEKLKNGAPFSYLRTIVVRYLETDDATLLPVICNVLSFSDDETTRVKAVRGVKAKAARGSPANSTGGYFSIPFLGSR